MQAAAGTHNWVRSRVIHSSIGLLEKASSLYPGVPAIQFVIGEAIAKLEAVELQINEEWERKKDAILQKRKGKEDAKD